MNVRQNLRCLMFQVIKTTENPYEKKPSEGYFSCTCIRLFLRSFFCVSASLFKHHHCAVCECILDNTVGRLKHQSLLLRILGGHVCSSPSLSTVIGNLQNSGSVHTSDTMSLVYEISS